jgi:hypothetical protein
MFSVVRFFDEPKPLGKAFLNRLPFLISWPRIKANCSSTWDIFVAFFGSSPDIRSIIRLKPLASAIAFSATHASEISWNFAIPRSARD